MIELKKKCVVCKEYFEKPYTTSRAAWSKREVCSNICKYKRKSQLMKGKTPKNIGMIAGMTKGKGKWYDCKGCSKKFQSPDYKTKYCTRECWLENRPVEFKPHPLRGEKHHYWKGGINTENSRLRNTLEYKQWRYEVLKRDNHTCVNCGSTENIRADHIKPFHLYPELRHDVDNGRALCKECDMKIGYCFFKENNPRKRITGVEIS